MTQEVPKDRLKEIFSAVGANIIRLRTGAGMSQEQLAEAAKVGRSTILAVEKGERCNLTNLLKIADALQVNPADLFMTVKDRNEVTYKTKVLLDRLSEVLHLK